MKRTNYSWPWLAALIVVFAITTNAHAQKDSQKLDKKVDEGMTKLMAASEAAKTLSKTAKGILLFPSVKKAGFLIGGQSGEGALRIGGKTQGYYRTTAASFGLQAGAQKFGYAMFFMNDGALAQLDKTEGFEVGVGPSVVVVDEGKAKTTTTTTAKDDIYAFVFGQKGLMAGLGIQGNKITKTSK